MDAHTRMGDLSLALKPSAKHGEKRGSEARRVLWKISEKGASAPLRARGSEKCEKGTQRRKGRRGRRACVMACMVVSMITLPLVVALFCSCCRKGNFQALVCSPTRRQRRGAYARDG